MTINKRPMVYIAHPMTGRSGDKVENFEKNKGMVAEICKYMMNQILIEEKEIVSLNKAIRVSKDPETIDEASLKLSEWGEMIHDGSVTPWFFAPQIYISQFINETIFPDKLFNFARGIAIEFCLAFVDRVDGIHVYKPEELSRGVMDDIERAAKMGKFVEFKEKYPWEG